MDQPVRDALDGAPATPEGIVVCPYLVSASGPWRSGVPARDHRCVMEVGGGRIDIDHQRRYCLGSGGPGCPRFAAADARAGFASMLPVVLERGPRGAVLEQPGLHRLAAPATVIVVGAALVALLLARGPGAPGSPAGAGGVGASGGSPASPAGTPGNGGTTATMSPAPAPSASPSLQPSPSPAPVSSPTSTGAQTYKVRSGDTLGAIAVRYGTTTVVLAKLNGIANPSLIRVGQVLQIPPSGVPSPSQSPTSSPVASPTPLPSPTPRPSPTPVASATPTPVVARTYTVQKGDTLAAIAARFGTTTVALAKFNGIADPSYIRVGQVLKLP